MKYALISPNEVSGLGYRVCETSDTQFPVAQPLFWIECDNNTKAEEYYYDSEQEKLIIKKPEALARISFNGIYGYSRLEIKTDTLPAIVTIENKSLNKPTFSKFTIEDAIFENVSPIEYSFSQYGSYKVKLEVSNESGFSAFDSTIIIISSLSMIDSAIVDDFLNQVINE